MNHFMLIMDGPGALRVELQRRRLELIERALAAELPTAAPEPAARAA